MLLDVDDEPGVGLGHAAGDVQQRLSFMLDGPVIFLGLSYVHGDARCVAVVVHTGRIQAECPPFRDIYVRYGLKAKLGRRSDREHTVSGSSPLFSTEVSFYYERVEGTWGICPSIGGIFG